MWNNKITKISNFDDDDDDDYDDCYIDNEDGTYSYNTKQLYKGHGWKSAILAQKFGVKLNEEELACIIYHMGAFGAIGDEQNAYAEAVQKYPSVLFTHTADMIASHVFNT